MQPLVEVDAQAGENLLLGYVYCLGVPLSASGGKGNQSRALLRAAGSQPRAQSRADVFSVGTTAAVFAGAAWQGSAVLHADAK